MATQLDYPLIIKNIIQQYAKYKPAHGDIETTVSFDDKHIATNDSRSDRISFDITNSGSCIGLIKWRREKTSLP
jgi:hypothetical protein